MSDVNNRYPFVSLRKLARLLGIDASTLRSIARRAGKYYDPYFQIKGDKARKIDRPTAELKDVQRRINMRIFRRLEMGAYLHGGIVGRSPLTNARVHVGQDYVVRIDIKDFFPSITPHQVFKVWGNLGFSPTLSRLLTQLTTWRGYLPQGAPTSTAIANLVLGSADELIRNRASRLGVNYSRFVDDVALSGKYPQQLVPDAVRAIQSADFRVSRRKLNIDSRGHRQELTGYTLNGATPSKSGQRRSRIRAAIFQLQALQGDTDLFCKHVRSIKGRIQDVRRSNPGAAAYLQRYLEGTLPGIR